MVPPEPAIAPVIPPVIFPIVQLNVLGISEVSVILGPVPLQVLAVAEFVTRGMGIAIELLMLLGKAEEDLLIN